MGFYLARGSKEGRCPSLRGQKRGSMSKKVLDELAEWIDPRAIAEAILQELESQKVEKTVPNGIKVWLDVLESQLPDGIRSSIKAIF